MFKGISIVLLAITLGVPTSRAAPPREVEVEVDVAAKLRPPRAQASQDDVVLYGADWCPQCRNARKYMASRRIAYRWVDTETPHGNAAYKSARGKQTGIPLLVVGRQSSLGFSVDSYDELFEKNEKSTSRKSEPKRR